jgi:hypothetical protein
VNYEIKKLGSASHKIGELFRVDLKVFGSFDGKNKAKHEVKQKTKQTTYRSWSKDRGWLAPRSQFPRSWTRRRTNHRRQKLATGHKRFPRSLS